MHQQTQIKKVRRAVVNILRRAVRLIPRQLWVVVTLAFVIGIVGQTAPAQAASARVPVQPYMDIVSPKTTVCVGKTVQYEARVYTPPRTVVGIEIDRYALEGITVDASSRDTNVGDFLNTRQGLQTRITGAVTGETSSLTNSEEEPGPHSAVFTFKAKKAGSTILYFDGIAQGAEVSFEVPVKVINCKYKVNIVMRWSTGMTILARSTDGVLTGDESGNFTGSANVIWVTSILCNIKSPIPPSQADLTGTLNASNQLVVNIALRPISSRGGGNCSAGGVVTANFGTFAPLTNKVPATRAVTTRKVQVVNTLEGKYRGTATITIIPVEDNR